MENVEISNSFWRNKKVLVTGHTGFKGSWLSLWLSMMGAKVAGYSLAPPSEPSMFEVSRISEVVDSTIADLQDVDKLWELIGRFKPEVVFHLAAQSLLPYSYTNPVETYATNVMGTVNLFEQLRKCPSVKVIVNITTDKCYENDDREVGYKENDKLGGYDPYSSSKACAEIVTSAYRRSFFNEQNVLLASARAGNVIGGGDWAANRLIPDVIRAASGDSLLSIRKPFAVRPWQHVLEPLSGYLLLAQALWIQGDRFADGWNFGPNDKDARTVEYVINYIKSIWPSALNVEMSSNDQKGHEARFLKLDISRVQAELSWQPAWGLEEALNRTVGWYLAYFNNNEMQAYSRREIEEYSKSRQGI